MGKRFGAHDEKETAQEMISNIREAFIELLDENHWMDQPTRKVARNKALKMNERIGYPDFITKLEELNKEYQNVGFFASVYLQFIGKTWRVFFTVIYHVHTCTIITVLY